MLEEILRIREIGDALVGARLLRTHRKVRTAEVRWETMNSDRTCTAVWQLTARPGEPRPKCLAFGLTG
jgi:hypothetical protein